MGKISKVISSILCGVLVIGAVAGAGTALYMGGKNNGWFDEYIKPDTEQSQSENGENIEVSEGMVIAPETNGKQMRVTSKALSASEYSDYGVSTQAENAYTLTAEVLPDYASDKKVNWSVAWADSNSEWARGKNVTNYVTVTPSSDGSITAVLACTQDFGEPVMLTVASRSNPNVCGVASINYYQRIKSLNYNIKLDGETVSSSADSHGVYKIDYTGAIKDYTVELVPVYSAYTLTDNYTTSISGKLSSTFGYTATSTLKDLKICAGLTGGDPEISKELSTYLSTRYGWAAAGAAGAPSSALSGYNNSLIKANGALSSADRAHPKYIYYTNCPSSYTYSQEVAYYDAYTVPPYTYYGASVATYNDFVSAVKKCNNAGVGVLQYTISITGTYSTYNTVLNLSYNDEFKIQVQNVNLSDFVLSF